MKKLIFISVNILLAAVVTAQTSVLNVKSNEKIKEEPVMFYFLPLTVLDIEVEAVKTIRKAGPYAFEASKYLGSPAEIMYDEEIWAINAINVKQKSEPDPANQYKVYASNTSNATLLTLTENGILKGVNLPGACLPEIKMELRPDSVNNKKEVEKDLRPKKKFVPNLSIVNENDSDSHKQNAEVAFEQIITLREARMNILAQNDEVLQNAQTVEIYLREIENQEKELIALFDGKEQKEIIRKTFTIYPDKEMAYQEIFRFSETQGFGTSGKIITITLKRKNAVAGKPAFSGKGKTGFAYRLPALTSIEIGDSKNIFWKGEVNVAQLGRLAYLPVGLFDKNDVKALFDTKSGALLQLVK